MYLPLEGTYLSVNIIKQSSSLPLSSFPNNWLYSWYTSSIILKRSLNCLISFSIAVMSLLENSKSSMVLCFLINLLLILLLPALRLFFLYVNPFSMRFLDLSALPWLTCRMTTPLALCSSHCEHELSPGMLDSSLIFIYFPILILIDHNWLKSCNPIWIPIASIWVSKICIQPFSIWHSSHKVHQILQLYIILVCYCTIAIWVNTLYLMDHLMNLSITINNRQGITRT